MPDLVTPEMLATCHREPIHRPGAIQAHGLLLVTDAQGRLTQVSANAAQWLGRSPTDLLGQELAGILPAAAAALVALPVGDDNTLPTFLELGELVTPAHGPIRTYWWGVRRARGWLLEGERVGYGREPTATGTIRYLLDQAADQERAIAGVAIAHVGPMLGYDRLMAYRFFPGGEGEVIAESIGRDLEPYLGLRYPASDVPDQVRILALRCPLRILVDAEATPIPLVPEMPTDGAGPLDLSLCTIRSQSPMYREYLRNMGFRSSLVASVIVNGRLWGLLIANHRQPHCPDQAARQLMIHVAAALGTRLTTRERGLEEALAGRCRKLMEQASSQIAVAGGWMEALAGHTDDLLDLVEASGAAIVTPDRVLALRQAPAAKVIREALAVGGTQLIHDGSNRALAGILGSVACGMLAVPVNRRGDVVLCWFRPEHNHEITWAGDMGSLGKSITVRPDGVPVFSPRRSFAAWTQQVRGLSRPWTRQDRRTAALIAEAVSGLLQRQEYRP